MLRPVDFCSLLTAKESKDIVLWFHDNCEYQEARTYGTVHNNIEDNRSNRSGSVMFNNTKPIPHEQKILDFIYHFSGKYNIDIWKGQLDWQLAKYEVGDHFKTHRDSHPTIEGMNIKNGVRKVSLTVQLSEETDYEGGLLRIENDIDGAYHLDRGIGEAAIFPSWLRHGIQPITKGTRYALVAWQRGPFWK